MRGESKSKNLKNNRIEVQVEIMSVEKQGKVLSHLLHHRHKSQSSFPRLQPAQAAGL